MPIQIENDNITLGIEAESKKDIFPEDIVKLVDKHALVPVYSFLTAEDQVYVIQKIHSEQKDSVSVTNEIREELTNDARIDWFSERSSNRSMLHFYNTVVGTKKNIWLLLRDTMTAEGIEDNGL